MKTFCVLVLGLWFCAAAIGAPRVEGAAAAAAGEIMTISVTNWDIINSFPEKTDDPMRVFLEDKFRIKFNPIGVTWSDANDKINIWAASRQLPDVIGAVATIGDGRYFQWVDDGVIRALPADLKAYPNVHKYVNIPEVTAFNVNGKTYVLPRMTYEDSSWWCMDRGILVRKDWMEKLGIRDPRTDDEFIDMVVRFVKEDPNGTGKDDTIGLVTNTVGFFWSQGFVNYGYTDGRWMKQADGKYHLANTTEDALQVYKFLQKLHRARGLDPDFATTNNDHAMEAYNTGRSGVLLRQVSPKHLQILADKWNVLQPNKPFHEYNKILPLWSVPGRQPVMFVEKAYWSETYVEGSVNDAKMARILQLYDYLFSDEGVKLCMFGFQGQDYEMASGQVRFLKKNPDGSSATAGSLYPLMAGGFSYLATWAGDLVQYINPAIDPNIRAMAIKERDYRLANWKVPPVDWAVQGINVPEKQKMSIELAADWTRFIIDSSGRTPEMIYQEMKANWRANGYDAAVDAITAEARRMGR